MNHHKLITATIALAVSANAMAGNEKMIINTTDGAKTTFDVTEVTSGSFVGNALMVNGTKVADLNDISNIAFVDLASFPFTITNPDGEIKAAYESVPSVLRVLPAESGMPTMFGFGNVKASTPDEIPEGEYGISLSLSPSAISGGGISDLAANPNSFILKLYRYENAQAVDSLTNVTDGSINYAWQAARRQLTLKINATFSDGTILNTSYTGTPTDVSSLEGIVPEKAYSNELVIVSPDGNTSTSYPITGTTLAQINPTTSNPYDNRFTFSATNFYDTLTLSINKELIVNKGDIDLATVTGNPFLIRFGTFQFFSTDAGDFKPSLTNGVMRITQNGDEYEIFVQFNNKYYTHSSWGDPIGGDDRLVTLHWKGEIK
ncbi:MAG: hypothetical protein K2L46_03430 [Paramuribaculum sp.]|nr:hypothetical protein [Paramuribaculum sp.]MDE6488309.1 hypothetical protein [Paramuribaculum sp.]